MDKVYRTVKSSKFAGMVRRKDVAKAVRTLSESKNGVSRDRHSVAVGSSLSNAAKSPAHAGSRWKKA